MDQRLGTAGNALIWLAYIAMSLMIWRLGVRRTDGKAFRGVAAAFALFIGLGVLGHFLDMLAFFHPLYRFSGHVLVVTGLVSGWSVWSLVRAWPALLAMGSLAEPEHVIAERALERARAYKELLESESRFRQLAESITQLVWIARPDGHIHWYNQRWYDYTGTTHEQMDGWGWQSVHDPVLLPEVIARWNRSIAESAPFEMAFPIRGADGRFREFLTRAVPSRDLDGRVTSWFGTNTDIDDQKRVEESLRESEAKVRQLADSMPLIVFAAAPDGHVDYYNAQWYEFTGGNKEIMGNESWMHIVHPDDLSITMETWFDAVATGQPFRIECRFKHHRTGEYRWQLSRALPAKDASGQITRWFGTAIDVHEERLQADALRESEARQRRAMSAARLAHWEWDLQSDQIIYQDSLARLFNRPDDRPFANLEDCLAVIYPDDHAVIRAAANRALVPGIPYEVEHRVIWPDGSIHWIACAGGAVFGEDGTPLRMVGINQDITDRKESEAQILLLNENLERLVHERTVELRQQIRLIDQAHDGIMVRSSGDVISSWNQGAERMYGWTATEAVGRVSHDRLKTQFPGALSDIKDELARIGSWDGELIHERKDGARIVVASRWVLDRDASGGGAILEINTDITEQRASEEALRRSGAALRESQRLAKVGSWEWEPVADVVTWSPEMYRIAGRDPSGPSYRHADSAELFTPEGIALLEPLIAAALQSGEPYEIELELIGGDGISRWITARGEAIRGPDQRVLGLRGTAQDITARRRAEEDLRRARDDAMAASRSKGEFLANMSHEIRTPMNAILGMTELTLDTDLTAEQAENLEIVQSAATLPPVDHQRPARLLQDRGRQARTRSHPLPPSRQPGRHAGHARFTGPCQGARADLSHSSRRPRSAHRRPGADSARSSSTW